MTQTQTLSVQQEAAINFALYGEGSAVLQAVAGAGKTTTLLMMAKVIKGTVAILSYNKKIAEEIKAKLLKQGVENQKVQAGTVHSFGFQAYRKAFPKVKVDKDKILNIIAEAVINGKISEEDAKFSNKMAKIVGLAKQVGIEDISNRNRWLEINDHFDVFDEEELDTAGISLTHIISICVRLLLTSNKLTSTIDFDDMVYLPVLLKLRFWQYDVVIVDEAQDTNHARREMAARMLKQGGRFIAVGDAFQAIYSFTGSDVDSLDLIKNKFNATELGLTVSFRCPKQIVQFARQWVDHIESHPAAIEGSVSEITFGEFLERKDLNADAFVLSRTTAPLIKTAFKLIRKGIPCKVEGREIGNGLKALATKWKRIKTTGALTEKLNDYLSKQEQKFADKPQKLETIIDQVETLKVVISACEAEKKFSVGDVIDWIEKLFGDNITGILRLMTLHRSKGLENKTIFWLNRRGTCPSKYAKKDWQMTAENNLCYVGATRAMENLVEVGPIED